MSEPWETDTLARLIDSKLRVLAQLREITLRQAPLIAADDARTLLRVFAAKQKLLEEIQRLDQELEPFRSQDPEERKWRTPELRAKCAAAAERCRQLVEEIKASELRDRSGLIERRDGIARRLEEAHAAAAAREAYRLEETAGRLNLLSDPSAAGR
jgi:flagellar biosynthesis/type III secretory pathway chaperone